ncbi:TPA: type-F conjugative transfer system protein TrbI [Kluyvera georgiana]|uniref:type-F conjugative transfer system protein TrbI n=1 Tax=Enterobacter hormaechei TaxID=158836 RepID=UPI002941098C|nr:type-F conjugative transfer system protein TrbI [Kluyvera georgiana]
MGESSMSEHKSNEHESDDTRVSTATIPPLSRPLVRIGSLVILQVVLTIAVSWATVKVVSPDVVAFDMKGTMDLFIQQTLEQKLPEEQTKVLMTRFNSAMRDSLQEWQDSHHSVILVAPAVVSQQTDITQEIRTGIATRMQGERR